MNKRILVTKSLSATAVAFGVFASSTALAADRTVTLVVKNMFCADCPFIVRRSLEGVPGVARVTVSFKDKTAVVTYDTGKADVRALTAATTNAGYPSEPKS
jgi:mercuric ion binding protein